MKAKGIALIFLGILEWVLLSEISGAGLLLILMGLAVVTDKNELDA